jgi:serine/threonine-protein kinase
VLGDTLGRGGMGEVMSAQDTRIGREVAIKRLRAAHPHPTAVARFLREARIQGRLDHPAIPPVHELDHDADGRPFFAMKKLSGNTLSEVLKEPGLQARFPRQRLLRAFADVCLAIELAHQRGIIHRDIKPSNILLGDFGEVYVIDWGVARMLDDATPECGTSEPSTDDVTAAGMTVGTPGYMAPEQVLGRTDLDGRADVFSLGCVLYEILTTRRLHPPGHAGLRSVFESGDARPSTHSDDIAPELDELCMRATATKRTVRIGSARELGEAVQRYLDGDRDLALRTQIAREHLAIANAALAASDDEHTRRTALGEAGRALALDPDLLEAAELIGRLMSTPLPTTPRAVIDELAALDRDAARDYAWVSVKVHTGYISLGLLVLLICARDAMYISLLTGLAIGTTILGVITNRAPTHTRTVALVVANVVTIAVFARMFSPFLVAPGIGVITLMRLAFHPAAHRKILVGAFAISLAAILGVWIAEVAGLVSPTMVIRDGVMLIHSPIAGLDAMPGAPALCMYVVALFSIAAVMSYRAARAQRVTRLRLHVQAWQLRQLLAAPPSRSAV